MATKIQRLKDWLCERLGCGPTENTEVVRIQGSNLERFRCEGYEVESEVYSDRLRISVYLKGELRARVWFYLTVRGEITHDDSIGACRSYKLRGKIRQYATQRLTELKEQNKV